jgi:hypothetical protein
MQVNTRLDARKVKLRLQVVASQPLVSLIQVFSALTRPVAYLELREHHGCVDKTPHLPANQILDAIMHHRRYSKTQKSIAKVPSFDLFLFYFPRPGSRESSLRYL